MTAVEQFFQDLVHLGYIEYPDENLVQDRLNLALEMEKEQIIDANIAGLIYPYIPGKPFGLEIAEKSKAEQYYNETYKKD